MIENNLLILVLFMEVILEIKHLVLTMQSFTDCSADSTHRKV